MQACPSSSVFCFEYTILSHADLETCTWSLFHASPCKFFATNSDICAVGTWFTSVWSLSVSIFKPTWKRCSYRMTLAPRCTYNPTENKNTFSNGYYCTTCKCNLTKIDNSNHCVLLSLHFQPFKSHTQGATKTKNFCVLHIQSNTTIFHLVVQ